MLPFSAHKRAHHERRPEHDLAPNDFKRPPLERTPVEQHPVIDVDLIGNRAAKAPYST